MSSLVLSCVISCSISFTALVFLLLHTFLKWATLPYARHCLGGCVLPLYLYAGHNEVSCCAVLLGLTVCICLNTFILSNSLDLVIAHEVEVWQYLIHARALCASTLFAHAKTLSLVCSSLFSVFSSLIISPNMFLSLSL